MKVENLILHMDHGIFRRHTLIVRQIRVTFTFFIYGTWRIACSQLLPHSGNNRIYAIFTQHIIVVACFLNETANSLSIVDRFCQPDLKVQGELDYGIADICRVRILFKEPDLLCCKALWIHDNPSHVIILYHPVGDCTSFFLSTVQFQRP